MTSLGSLWRRRSCRNSFAHVLAMSAAALIVAATNAFAQGSISGHVTSSTTTQGILGTTVVIIDINSNQKAGAPLTDATGAYSANVPPGTYAVFTQDTHGYINQIYNNVPCSATCNTNALSQIVITNAAVSGIDFVLDPGGRIAGNVTSQATGLPIAGVTVNFTDSTGQIVFTTGVTDPSGNYIADGGTATGNVFAYTTNTLGYQNEVYTNGAGNPHCFFCDPTVAGLPIAVTLGSTTNNINFILDQGGQIAGTVTNASAAPLADIQVRVSDSTGNDVEKTFTDASGNYATAGLPAGSYFVYTFRTGNGLLDELYNNIPCVDGNCNRTVGTAIAVTVGATASGKNLVLPAGGTVTGKVTNAVTGDPLPNAFVPFFTIGTSGPNLGLLEFLGGANTHGDGTYSAVLPAGTAFAVANDPQDGFANQLYNGLPCAGALNGNFTCNIQSGTPLNVTSGGTINNVNFALAPGAGSISGTVTNAAGGAALANITVQVFTSSGVLAGIENTDGSGNYTFNSLAPGSYYVRTNTNQAFINQLYNGVVCVGCGVTSSGGTLVVVTSGGTTTGINFSLSAGGRITGTITNAAGGATLQGIPVQLFSSSGAPMATTQSNASGVYTSFAVPPGSYFVRTVVSPTENFVDQLYTALPCVPCSVMFGNAVVVVGTATTSGINFALSAGGSITGTVTDAGAGGAPIPSVGINVFDSAGVSVKNVTTNASGVYTVTGLPNGNYFVRANPNAVTQNYVPQMYNGMLYVGSPLFGTPVAVTANSTTSNINFALVSGGTLSGTVTDGTNGIANVQVDVYSPLGQVVKNVVTDSAGHYTMTGIPAGSYSVSTNVSGFTPFYQDELYDNIPCVGCVTPAGAALPLVVLPCTGSCLANGAAGTPVAVTNGATHSGVDFVLASGGGAIAGTVTSAANGAGLVNVEVLIFDSTGVLVKSTTSAQNAGGYGVRGLAPGTYYARTAVSPGTPYYTDQAYSGVACAPCDVTTSTPITVTADNTTSGIDFALAPAGSVSGVVTDAATASPVAFVGVIVANAAGSFVKGTVSTSSGTFTVDGLPAGTYYARTSGAGTVGYADRLFNNLPWVCCNVTAGTAIVVTNGATHSGVNFALLRMPAAVTVAASVITPLGATLNGSVNPNGSNTTAVFQYGLTTSYGSQAAVSPGPGAGTSAVAVSVVIGGLTCNTTYHFRVVATSAAGTANGSDATFTTVASPCTPSGVDFNSDGQPDLIWQNDATRQAATWYMGGAQGNTILGVNYLGASGAPGWSVVATGDFNNDGHADLVWQNDTTRQVGVWYMGGAQGNTVLGVGFLGAAGATGVPGWHVAGVGDFNKDGHPDLVWQNDTTRQVGVWYMGGAQGNVTLGVGFLGAAGAIGVPGWSVVGIGDFNNDGQPDLVWQNDSTRQIAAWYMGGAQGDVFLGVSYLGAAGAVGVPGWTVVGVGDFNKDGHPDIVWQSDALRQVAVWYMGGAQGNVFLGAGFLGAAGATGVPGWHVIAR